MATITGPTFHDLTTEEADALLKSRNVGRIAFTLHDRVDIEPIGSTDTYLHAERLLTTLVPGTFSVHDPVPHRNILFGIYVNEIAGKASRR